MHNYYYCHYQITGILMSEYQVHAETANIGLGTPVQLNAMYEEAAHNRKRELASCGQASLRLPRIRKSNFPVLRPYSKRTLQPDRGHPGGWTNGRTEMLLLEPMEAESQHPGRQIGPV